MQVIKLDEYFYLEKHMPIQGKIDLKKKLTNFFIFSLKSKDLGHIYSQVLMALTSCVKWP